jgi:nucleoid-associated protein YgaU
MKIISNRFFWVSVLVLLMVSIPLSTYANPQKMKYKDYLVELERWKAREQAARTSSADEQVKIDNLKKQIQDTNTQTDKTWDEIFTLLGVTRADYERYQKDLTDLESKVRSFQALTPEQLYQRKAEVEAADNSLKALQANRCALIPRVERRLNALQRDLEGVKARVPAPKSEIYTVVRGDCLWRIAAKPKIYNDPYKWMRIWSANLDIIPNPNIIHVSQNLTILRDIDKNQYIVIRGDFLSKIAGYPQIYGNPFQWKRIYEANKRMIKDPNVIYPEMVLAIPR